MRENRLWSIKPSPFFKDVAYTAATSVASGLGLIVLTRLLAHGLGPDEFGVYTLARRVLAVMAPLTTLSMGIAVARYTAISTEDALRRLYLLCGSMLAVAPSALLFGVGAAFQKELSRVIFHSDSYAKVIRATLFMLVGYSIYTLLYAFYRGTGKMGRANLWQLSLLVVGPILIAGVYARGGQVHRILYVMGALFLSAAVPLAMELWRLIGSQAAPAEAVRAGKDLMRYGVPRVPGSGLLAGLFSLGPLLAPYFGSPKEAGYLVVGQSVFSLSEAGLTAFGLVVLPKAAQLVSEGRLSYLRERVSDVLAFTIHFGLFSAVQLFVWSDEFVHIWLGHQYNDAISLMRILLLAAVPYFVYVMLRSVLDAVEERAVNTRNLSISMAVAVVSSLGLGMMGFGSRGLALGTASGFTTLGLATVWYLWRERWVAWNRLHVTESLTVNIAALVLAIWFRSVISQFRISTAALLALALIFEGTVFVLYYLALRQLRVEWTVQVEQRVVGGRL